MSAEYSGDRLVQQMTADYFQQELGWESFYAFDKEQLGTNGTLGCQDQTEVILTRYLRTSLEQFNPTTPPKPMWPGHRKSPAYR